MEIQTLTASIEQRQVRYDNDLLDDDEVKALFMDVGRCWGLQRDLAKLLQGIRRSRISNNRSPLSLFTYLERARRQDS